MMNLRRTRAEGSGRRHDPRRTAEENSGKPGSREGTAQSAQAREKILEALVKRHDFPVPEALIENQMDVRLERVVRSLAAQGVDPRAVNVDWVSLRRRQHDRAVDDVKAELLLDRIATRKKSKRPTKTSKKRLQRLRNAVANPQPRCALA